MTQNICEHLREKAVGELFGMNTFADAWGTWRNHISTRLSPVNPRNIIDLGDYLSEVFRSTSAGRTQSSVSSGGTVWEGLVCWYLNLCLIGTRTVVVKQKRALIPEPIRDAIVVNYGTFPSNTESDLIAITFPEIAEYSVDKFAIRINDSTGNVVNTSLRGGRFNYKAVINALVERDFRNFEVDIIQCKTNWNDNAQIPMLWDMVYSAGGFRRRSISIGRNNYTIDNLNRFSYSFVTVPTVSDITSESTCVHRVRNLSGGNYWGQPSVVSVASSIKEIFTRNFTTGTAGGLVTSLGRELPNITTTYSYFQI